VAGYPYVALTDLLAEAAVHEDTSVRHDLAWKRWKEYCRNRRLAPETEPTVAVASGFIVHLIKINSIHVWESYKSMVDGVKATLEKKDISTKAFYSKKFQRVITGLRKTIGKLAPPKKSKSRATCTPELLKTLLPHFRRKTIAQRNARRAATVAAVAAFRLGELVETRHNKGKVPLSKHVITTTKSTAIFLPWSKTDLYHKGVTQKIPPDPQPVSATQAITECANEVYSDKSENKPFFCDANRKALTDVFVMGELHAALLNAGKSTTGFTTKCFRRGAAKSLKQKGGNEKQIKKLGRWKSNAYKTYLEEDINPSSSEDWDDKLILKKRKNNTKKNTYRVVKNQSGVRITLSRTN
jgi:hypothetical protein